jgi:hypothetical protein
VVGRNELFPLAVYELIRERNDGDKNIKIYERIDGGKLAI